MLRVRSCNTCKSKHYPPTGRNCQTILQAPGPSSSHDNDVLAAIASIGKKLDTYGERLTQVERKQDERQTDPPPIPADEQPTLHSLQADRTLQEAANDRLRTIQAIQDVYGDPEDGEPPAGGAEKKRRTVTKKSGRVQTADDIIVQSVDWPHYYVYRGPQRSPANYELLTVHEFVWGFLEIVNKHVNEQALKEKMLSHLQMLMEDCSSFTWDSIRNFHGIFLQQCELGNTSWDDEAYIQKLRWQYTVQPHPAIVGPGEASVAGQKSKTHMEPPSGPPFCLPYQSGNCRYAADHNTSRGFVKHCCAYCLKITKQEYPHTESECRRKAKNGQPHAPPPPAQHPQ